MNNSGHPDTLPAPSPTWLRIFATLYDPSLWLGEIASMRRTRRALLAGACGRVVEIGAGTGLNLAHYPPAVDELILTEPEPGMRQRLERRVAESGCAAQVLDARATELPLGDGSVDTVVSTLVLCTVDDPQRTLQEIARVLRPGGRLLFVEHVRAGSRLLAAIQDVMMPAWRGFAGGCVCNRRTLDVMRRAGFTVETSSKVWHLMPAVVRPLAVGWAVPGSGAPGPL